MKIEVSITGESKDWQRVAMKAARHACDESGVDWLQADVLVRLPEPGRCMIKIPGKTQLVAVG